MLYNHLYENHHTITLSTWWPDTPANLMKLKRNTHTQLHQTLNMHPNILGKFNRQYRKLANDRLIANADMIDCQHEMQKRFFENLKLLPKEIQEKHITVFRRLIEDQIAQYNAISDNRLEVPWEQRTIIDTVDLFHDTYTQYRKLTVEEIRRALYHFRK